MRDILAGGVLVTHDAVDLDSARVVYSRRRSRPRPRDIVRIAATIPAIPCVQPGQLVSPLLKFGFPSLAVH